MSDDHTHALGGDATGCPVCFPGLPRFRLVLLPTRGAIRADLSEAQGTLNALSVEGYEISHVGPTVIVMEHVPWAER